MPFNYYEAFCRLGGHINVDRRGCNSVILSCLAMLFEKNRLVFYLPCFQHLAVY